MIDIEEARKALYCLFIATNDSVASYVRTKIAPLLDELAALRAARDEWARRTHESDPPGWTAWLIEDAGRHPNGVRYASFNEGGVEWTSDPLKACHFVRRQDAESMAFGEDCWKICEHSFGVIAGKSRPITKGLLDELSSLRAALPTEEEVDATLRAAADVGGRGVGGGAVTCMLCRCPVDDCDHSNDPCGGRVARAALSAIRERAEKARKT